MNEPTTTKKSEFVFRRLAESFDQFTDDIWAAIPTWLLAIVAITVVARIVYRYTNPASRAPGAKDPVATGLGWAMWISVATLVVWMLVAFYNRETDQTKGAVDAAVSTLGSGNAAKWYTFTIGIFALGSVFVVLMYIKDTRSVRWFWAAPLALLRMCVYAILCFVFLLPAMQTWEDTNKQSRVVVLLDISDSVGKTSDETGASSRKKRIDHIIEFLSDEKIAFIKNLLDKNPVAVYAFGSRLDESPQVIEQGAAPWSKAEWDAFARYDFRPYLLRGLSDEGKEQIQKSEAWQPTRPKHDADWAATWFAQRAVSAEDLKKFSGLSADADVEALRKNLERLDKRIDVARTIALGTNVADSIRAAVNREAANMVQGVIVISDGRSNLGSDSGFIELRERANREKIPIFTIAVGEDRETASVVISDLQAPDTAPIDEAWEIIVEADGANMANKQVEVELHLFKPGTDFKAVDKDDYPIGSDEILRQQLTFAPGDPPHGQVKFVIDPAKLPEKLTTESKDAAIKKRVLLEGKWNAKAVIKKQPEETFIGQYHVRARPGISVLQQKLRVLLVADAPGREFTFLRTLLVREVQDKRATLTTFVQNEAGTTGNLTPELGETVIRRFPNRFDVTNKNVLPEDKPYNLNEYDVIIAFDPDWTEISQQQAEDLGRWVHEGGGGLIYVGGSINTFQLARDEKNSGKLQPLLQVLPVEPDDIVAQNIRASPKTPRRLMLHPDRILGSELLKLDEKVPNDPIAGWEPFFTDRDKYTPEADLKKELFPHRGFFSAYPVKKVRPGCIVLAEFMDVSDSGEADPQPWIVINNPSAAYRSAFLASAELYRLRPYEPDEKTGQEYFERFWFKMIKYMAAKRNFKAARGRVLVSKEGVSGSPLRVQARILNESAKPYDRDINAKFRVVREAPGGEKREISIYDLARKESGVGFDGYYAGQLQLDPKLYPPGDYIYRVIVDVPDSQGETLTGEFRVRKSDPEMDNTRPDFPAMLRMASDFTGDNILSRVPDRVKSEYVTKLPKEGGVPRLAFRLNDRELLPLIPECMISVKSQNQNRGPVNDLWDRSFAMPTVNMENPTAQKYLVSWWSGQRLSIVLLVVVFLLSLEWLVRKLLRLA